MPNDPKVVAQPRPPGKRVLVVDDDDVSRRQLRQTLEACGYLVQDATNGQDALDLLRRGPVPAIILLDLTMPVLDGWAFRAQQRREASLATIPVVILSTSGAQVWHADELGDVGFLRTPVDPAELDATLKRFIGPRRPEVLVVEDEVAVRKMLDVALRHHGFVVWQAATSAEAIQMFREHLDTIDVVLIDVQMPVVDGPKTLAALQAIGKHVPAVYMSGSTGDYSVEELLRTGAVHVLQKPFASMVDLARILTQAADSARPDHSQEGRS
jgi:CheY-like chemotaxis protein